MAKKAFTQSSAQERVARTEAYAESVRKMFNATVNDIIELQKTMPKVDDGVMYSFDGDSPEVRKQVEKLLRRLHSSATVAIEKGISLEWEKANAECDSFIRQTFGKHILDSTQFRAWTAHNETAMAAFINRSDKGMNLSDRVWQSCRQLRDEMEIAITVGIGDGTSAAEMSRSIRHCLNDPDLMFRRFRYKVGEEKVFDSEGNEIGTKPIWGKKWKKKVIVDGKTKFIDYDKDSYIPKGAGASSRGVYKSSAKNAMRVARTETNMAYRRADFERWQNMSFVLGIKIELSNQHPDNDICDEMQGEYPKNFYFGGWHPQCFCYATPILVSEDEMAKVSDEFLKGNVYQPKGEPVVDTPQGFKDWVSSNSERIQNAKSLPYWIKDNPSFVDAKKGVALIPDADEIRALFPKDSATVHRELLDGARAAMPENCADALNARMTKLEQAINNGASDDDIQKLYNRVMSGVETQKKWDKLVWDGFDEGQRKSLEEFAKTIGVRKGRPMTHEQANSGRVNPLYQKKYIKNEDGKWVLNPKYEKGYSINCQTCAPTYALRRMGFNIEALKYEEVDSFKHLASHYRDAWKWKNPYSYKKTKSAREIFNAVDKGDDSVWQVQCVWKGGKSGHTFNIVKENGETFFYDPQTNRKFKDLNDFKEYSNDVSPTYGYEYFRIDKKWVDNRWLGKNVQAYQERMTEEQIRKHNIEEAARKRHASRPEGYAEKLMERRRLTQDIDKQLAKANDFAWSNGVNDWGKMLREMRFSKGKEYTNEQLQKRLDILKENINKERNILIKTATNLQNLSKKYGYDSKISDLAKGLENPDTYTELRNKTREIAKAISAEVKDNRLLGQIIPDVEKWKGHFSSDDLHKVYDAVKKKIDDLNTMSLTEQKKQLAKEAMYVANPNYLKPHKLHTTWQVAESAYTQQLHKVEIKIKTNELTKELGLMKASAPKFKALQDKMDDIEVLIKQGKLNDAEMLISETKIYKSVVDKYQAISSYHTPKFDALMAEAKTFLDAGDVKNANAKINDAEKLKKANEAAKAKNAQKAADKKAAKQALENEIKEATKMAWDDLQEQELVGKLKIDSSLSMKIDATITKGDFKKAQKLLNDNFGIDVNDEANKYRQDAKSKSLSGSLNMSLTDSDILVMSQRLAERRLSRAYKSGMSVSEQKEYDELRNIAKSGNVAKLKQKLNDMHIDFNDPYSNDRKDSAFWTTKGMESYEELGMQVKRVWIDPITTMKEKEAAYAYTYEYSNINEPLRGLTYYGSADKTKRGLNRIPELTRFIDRTSLDHDMWFQRGDGMVALKKFGLSNYNTASDAEIMALVGKTGNEGAFWSMGTSKGDGFSGDIIFNVYAPKGTKGMYMEPISAYGHGARSEHWSGDLSQTDTSQENEYLMQRGTKFKVVKVEKSGYRWYIDIEVVEQDVLPFPYVGGYPYK